MQIKNTAHFKQYMKDEHKVISVDLGKAYTYYFCRSFLERLFKTNPTFFTLIGSYSQAITMGDIKRPLTDIDVQGSDLNKSMAVVKEALEDSKQDPIVFNLHRFGITPDNTACYKIVGNYETISRIIGVDVTAGSPFTLVKTSLAPVLTIDTPFQVQAIDLEEHLARKLRAIYKRLQLYMAGKGFRRYKDFYDVDVMLKYKSLNIEQALEYFSIYKEELGNDINPNMLDAAFIAKHQSGWHKEAASLEFQESSFTQSVVNVKNLLNQTPPRKEKSR